MRESRVFSLTEVDAQKEVRDSTKIQEFDRVLGGGIVGGSVILFSGEPGIGKSTLMMQVCANMTDTKRILYVSGEESLHQLKLRGDRLGMADMRVLSETSLEDVLAAVVLENPHILIIDSIQTMYTESLNSAPGSVAQVKSCALEFIQLAKQENITVFLIGHVH
jgi:DNA repair protein RadA/Sms